MVEQKKTHGTSGGVELTDELIEELSREAERGYPPESFRPRQYRGRPSMGDGPARVFQVRLPPDLRDALERQADEEGRTKSEVVRRALEAYLEAS